MGVLKVLVWTIYGRRRAEADTPEPEKSVADPPCPDRRLWWLPTGGPTHASSHRMPGGFRAEGFRGRPAPIRQEIVTCV